MPQQSPEILTATRAAHAAGAITLNKFGELRKSEIHTKEFKDFVTETDRQCEAEISLILSEAFPEDGMLCEEGTTMTPRSGRRWIVDPLDGTLNFIHSFPVFSISIALQGSDGELIAGVIYLPITNELFTAEPGKGALLNGKPIRVTDRKEEDGYLIATGLPFKDYGYLDSYMEMLREVIHISSGVRRAGSAAIDLAYTACGRFDGFWEYKLLPWDFAAGVLLVREAGGIVTDFHGKRDVFSHKSIIAGSSLTHPLLLSMAQRHFPPEDPPSSTPL
ncbi:inositol monophosphatase [Chlorobium phaeovibrioides]|uniref:Inositol-1-monophosphatase n=1 Tax=Chlorobium phaeovibrioides (strain DSM 265 / 1930) TaxID=290318 RepID=A4SG30_CHLPM|nr:inositol monophosphatase family protein [Chlorobium phaeovibrioides]RTY35851.1 inositol monophosphatase [Chlorobium phaeovibrioides]HCD36063.1 inositol monophosphatase [Chlorobium sp.]